MLALGASVGQYIVERVIGRGGMATVYRVRHRDLGTQHALKVLHVQRRGLRERFLQEGRLQANIRHPNLVAVTDVVWSGEHPGLVLELVDGPTLADVVAQGPLPVTEALRLFRQIVDGVHHAHAQGLVHRDLKPQNVLLGTGADGLRQARVADFGIAKVLAGSEEPALTRSGMPIGTPRYMAPEQIRDASRVDARADIFSLGCILYEMVCGAPPLQGTDLISLYDQAMSGSYADASSQAELPTPAAVAIRGALVGDRSSRIPDCRTLIAVLEGAPWSVSSSDTFDPDELYDAAEGRIPTVSEASTSRLGVTLLGLGAVGLAALAGLALAWWPEPAVEAPQVGLFADVHLGVSGELLARAPLSEAEASERPHYRVRHEGGQIVEVEHRDATGALFGSDPTPIARQRFDESGQLERITYFDASDAPVREVRVEWRETDGGLTSLHRYLDGAGRPMRDPLLKVYATSRTQDARGQLLEERHLDVSLGQTACDAVNRCVTQYTYGEGSGSYISKASFGADGEPVVGVLGCHRRFEDRSLGEGVTRTTCIGVDGQPSGGSSGVVHDVSVRDDAPAIPPAPIPLPIARSHEIRYQSADHSPVVSGYNAAYGRRLYYDGSGHRLMETRLGPDGLPTDEPYGYASEITLQATNTRRVLFADARGTAVTGPRGCAIEQVSTRHGVEVQASCWDVDERPARNVDGWCLREQEADAEGRVVRSVTHGCSGGRLLRDHPEHTRVVVTTWEGATSTTRHFDGAGRAVADSEGAHQIVKEHTSRRTVAREVRTRADGDLAAGLAAQRREWNEQGRVSRVTSLGPDGEPADGPHACEAERLGTELRPVRFDLFDPPAPEVAPLCGELVSSRWWHLQPGEQRLFLADGSPAPVDGCPIRRIERTAGDRPVAVTCHGVDGDLQDGEHGFAQVERRRDNHGRLIDERLLAADGSPVALDGVWRTTRSLDRYGRPTQVERYDAANTRVGVVEYTYGERFEAVGYRWLDGAGHPAPREIVPGVWGAAVEVVRDVRQDWVVLVVDGETRIEVVERDPRGRTLRITCTGPACPVEEWTRE